MGSPLLSRLAAAGALLVVLAALCVWFGSIAPAPALGAYPGSDDVVEQPDRYVGSQVEISGVVVGVDPVVIVVTSGFDTRHLTVTDLASAPREGETLRVFGRLDNTVTVRADRAFAVPPSGYYYTYAVSFLAGLWVLARLVAHWRVDPARGIVRRSTRWAPLARLRAWRTEVFDGDA